MRGKRRLVRNQSQLQGAFFHGPEGPNGSAVSLSEQLVFHSESSSVGANPKYGVAWGRRKKFVVSGQWTRRVGGVQLSRVLLG